MSLKLTALQEASDKFSLGAQASEGMLQQKIENENIKDYVFREIKKNELSTMGIDWKLEKAYVTIKEGSRTDLAIFSMSKNDYILFCIELGLSENEKYNASETKQIEGVICRIYAIMPPVAKAPIITISTTKEIPTNVINDPVMRQSITDELLNKIVHSTFIVGGGSGAGKTYFLNALLGNFIRDDERLAIVEEFGELTPPNNVSVSLTTPPAKPKEEPLLRWVTEASNLMRLDALVVGEIKSSEAYPFILNASSGTRGIASVHGKDARKVLSRLVSLAMLAIDNKKAIQDFIAKSINYVIILRKHEIFEIVQLTGNSNNDNFTFERIYSNPKLLEDGERFN